MGLRSAALLCALVAHLVLLSFALPEDTLQAPKVKGGQSIEIQFSSVEKMQVPVQTPAVEEKSTPVVHQRERSLAPESVARIEPRVRKLKRVRQAEPEQPEQPEQPQNFLKPQEKPAKDAAIAPSAPEDSETAGVAAQYQAGAGKTAVVKAVPAYSRNRRPAYPAIARRRGWEGKVVLEVLVLADGSAGKVTILHGSGHDLLDTAALGAVRQWTFVPGAVDGAVVAMRILVPIVFQLTGH